MWCDLIALCLCDFCLLVNGLVARGMVGGDAYEMRLALGFTPWDLMGRHGKPVGETGIPHGTPWEALGG